jgi:hypothetical protein
VQILGGVVQMADCFPPAIISGQFIAARQDGHLSSAQLAVFAAAPVDSGESRLLVAYGLTRDAGPCADHRLSASQRDRFAAILAFFEPIAGRHTCPRSSQLIPNAVLDLVLNSAITRPSTCHVPLS